MGWDVVEIGLKHDLPVHDAFETARIVAKRMKRNIKLVYEKELEYDMDNNSFSGLDEYICEELGFYRESDDEGFLQMTAKTYYANQMLELVGTDRIKQARFEDEWARESFISSMLDPFDLYEIESKDETDIDIRIFQENVDLDVCVRERWSYWERAFHKETLNEDVLRDYRRKFFERACLFGCKEVIICCDQGPGAEIYDNIGHKSDELKHFALTSKYLESNSWLDKTDKEWKQNARCIDFPSFFGGKTALSDKEFVEVIYDDFRDMIE